MRLCRSVRFGFDGGACSGSSAPPAEAAIARKWGQNPSPHASRARLQRQNSLEQERLHGGASGELGPCRPALGADSFNPCVRRQRSPLPRRRPPGRGESPKKLKLKNGTFNQAKQIVRPVILLGISVWTSWKP